MNKRFIILYILPFIFISAFPQGELETESEIFFRNEKSIAALLCTNGLGVNILYAKRVDAFRKTLYQFDIAGIKHPKEIKVTLSTPPIETGNSFVYGKLNRFYNIRLGVGRQKEIYRKIDKGGISIRRIYTGGINLGLEKPVYYEVQEYAPPPIGYVSKTRKFNTEPHAINNIEKYAPYFKGFNETKLIPGLFAKYGYMFEYGKNDKVLHAIEGGFVADIFPRPIHLMAHNDNDFFFVGMYISYRIGKVTDSRFKTKKNKLDRILPDI